jgi:hypothetical protein
MLTRRATERPGGGLWVPSWCPCAGGHGAMTGGMGGTCGRRRGSMDPRECSARELARLTCWHRCERLHGDEKGREYVGSLACIPCVSGAHVGPLARDNRSPRGRNSVRHMHPNSRSQLATG